MNHRIQPVPTICVVSWRKPEPQIADYIWWRSMEVFCYLLYIPSLMLLKTIRTSYSHEAQVVHMTMVLHISFYFWVGFPLQPTTYHIYHTCGRAVWWWNHKIQKSCLSLFREKSSYKHPIKKHVVLVASRMKKSKFHSPRKTSSKTAPLKHDGYEDLFGRIWGGKSSPFQARWFRGGVCFLLGPAI